MAAFVQRVAEFIRKEHLLEPEALVLAGVSGGVDSMVLLDVLVRLDTPVIAAHVNYGLRGDDADADEALVRERCAEYDVPLEIARYPTRDVAANRGQSIQEAARDLRYAFFGRVAMAAGAPAVAVAHHADDQAETLLLNLFRGTGIDGLAAMPTARALAKDLPLVLVRPLLRERREEIVKYALANDIPWREDVGNDSTDYARTHIRNSLLPAAEAAFDSNVVVRLARTADFVRAYLQEVLTPELRQRFDACAVQSRNGGLLAENALRNMARPLQTRLILAALERWLPGAPRDAATATRIAALLDAQVGRYTRVGGGEVWREREGLRFLADTSISGLSDVGVPVPLEEATLDAFGGRLTLERVLPPFDLARTDEFTVVADEASLQAPLLVRSWRPGDVIRPLGMRGHKKLSDLLTEARIPSHARAGIPVVCAGNRIVWVPGVRLSETVRVTEATRSAWKLTFTPERSWS